MNRVIIKFKDGEIDRLSDLCRGAVWDDRSMRRVRCSKRATVTEVINGQEVKFCKIHSSAAQAARDAKAKARWAARNAAWDASIRRNNALGALLDAVLNADHSALPPEVQKAVLEYLEAHK
jgi:hypothetical protein